MRGGGKDGSTLLAGLKSAGAAANVIWRSRLGAQDMANRMGCGHGTSIQVLQLAAGAGGY
jgi:hypothetical protein